MDFINSEDMEISDVLNHNQRVFEKIRALLFSTLEKLEYGKIRLELTVHNKKITKLVVHGKKVIK